MFVCYYFIVLYCIVLEHHEQTKPMMIRQKMMDSLKSSSRGVSHLAIIVVIVPYSRDLPRVATYFQLLQTITTVLPRNWQNCILFNK